MKLLLVTGMSGAGKSRAADVLEDLGYYCIDNVPPKLIPSLIDLAANGAGELSRMAVITDVRGGSLFQNIESVVAALKQSGIYLKILFLDASNEVLIRRYKENRRKHPLCERNDIPLSQAVAEEREMVRPLRQMADYVVDTSQTSNAQFKERLTDLVIGNDRGTVHIQCKSFGFKYGADTEADLVFDVRCLPNPFYIESLKHQTGLDKDIEEYIFGFAESVEFERRL
ncbi:MAG: RNase adapter RapZ, partial [Clostridia bacterium]|nr:RNase adapter RapZ [Clostridia bacterium]